MSRREPRPELVRKRLSVPWQIICVFGLAGILGVIGALVSNLPSGAINQLATVFAGALLVCLGWWLHKKRYKKLFFGLILSYWLVLCVWVFIEVVPHLLRFSRMVRPSAFLGNPNLLGAAIATSGVIILVLLSRRTIPWTAIPTVLALIATGSRLALVAYLIGIGVYYFTRTTSPTLGWIAVITIPCCAIFIPWMVSEAIGGTEDPAQLNLLEYSDVLVNPVWNTRFADSVVVTRRWSRSPAGGRVYRLQGIPGEPEPDGLNIFIKQRTKLQSVQGENYTASVFLRSESDEQQKVSIRTVATSAECTVTEVWSRCITPPGLATGRSNVYFELRVNPLEEFVDLEVAGIQVEQGRFATEPDRTTSLAAYLKSQPLVLRYGLDAVLEEAEQRKEIMTEALRAFMQSPIAGHGVDYILTAATVSSKDEVSTKKFFHAHNLPLDLGLTYGIFGLLAWIIAFFGIWWGRLREVHLASPIVVCVLLLNLLDVSFFNAGGFYIYWLACGFSLAYFGEGAFTKPTSVRTPRSFQVDNG